MAVPPPSPDVDKTALRRDLRARRLAYAGDATAIYRHLGRLLDHAGPFGGYIAHRGEPDILPFLRRAAEIGHTICVPHVPVGARMYFERWRPDMRMTAGIAGIPQPPSGKPIEPAIVLTPLLGFDRSGRRLGQGGGHYDRWFADHPQAMRIGIAWSVQEVAELVPEAWDVPMHAIVTEKEWIEP